MRPVDEVLMRAGLPGQRLGASVLVLGALIAGPATPATAKVTDTIAPRWEVSFANWDRTSSPQLSDLDRDGRLDIVFGSQDGWLRALDSDGRSLAGWPRQAKISGAPVAVDSTPGIGDLDNDGRSEIAVGVGSTFKANQQGGLVVFESGGATRCSYRTRDVHNIWTFTGVPDGYSDGVFSSPAIGDVDGDGNNDIVFGGFDLRIHAIDRNCRTLPGFPFYANDTVWSSPALFDVDRDGRQEIFIGADWYANGPGDPASGGRFRRIDWSGGRAVETWSRAARDVFTSSPAIGDIDGDQRLEAIVGAGDFFHQPDANKVFAFHLDNGSTVAGWPRSTSGVTRSSPALGDLTGDGVAEVVIGSRDGQVHAFRGNGTSLWSRNPGRGNNLVGSPIIADLDGDDDQDVGIGNSFAFYLMRGHDGATMHSVNSVLSFESSGAVGDFGADGRQLVTVGFDTPGYRTRLRAHPLPTSSAPDAWPSFGRNARNLRATPSDPPLRPQCHGRANRRAPSSRSAPFRSGPALDVDGDYDLVAPTNVDGDGGCDVALYARGVGVDGQLRLDAGGVPEVVQPALGGLGDAIVPLDYNGDGYGDLLIYARGSTSDYLRKGTAFGFVNGPRVDFDGDHDFALPGDFNGDGRGDVLFYGRGTRPDSLWLGTARGLTLGPALTITVRFDLVVSGDFNGDRVTDVLYYQAGSDAEMLKLGTRYGVFVNGTAPNVGATYDAIVAGDFNGDGADDVVFYGRGSRGDSLRRGGRSGIGGAKALTINQTFDHITAGDLDGDLLCDLIGVGDGPAPDRILLGN